MKESTPFYAAVVALLFVTSVSYAQHPIYRPTHLQNLPDDTLISRARKRIFVDHERVVIKDSIGNVIGKEEAEKIDYTVYFGELYADEKGEIREMVIRKITAKDRKLLAQLNEAIQEGEEIVVIDVNCADAKSLLEQIHDIDQRNRTADREIDMNVDRDNKTKVISIIEKCGWPTKEQVGQKGMESIFLVIQHGSKKLRTKYFPFIKGSAEKGELNLASVALMEDRMLVENGQKQKFGSQVVSHGDGPWMLHPIEDPENVNERRAAMGLEPIEEYLKRFGIEYHPDRR